MSTAFFDRHSRWQRALLISAPALLVSWQVGCGDTAKLSCGPGTVRAGDQCVLEELGTGGTGDPDEQPPEGGSDGSGTSGSAPTDRGGAPMIDDTDDGPRFDGISSTAPASDVAVQVTWAPAEDATTAASDLVYRVYVATKSGKQNFSKPAVTSPPGASSALVGNLEPDTDYYFVVRAVDADGNEDQNAVELVGTPSVDDEAPEFDGVKRGTPAGAAEIELSWSPASDDKTPPEGISYIVRWGTTEANAPVGTVIAHSAPGATSVVVSGLPAPSEKYYFNVTAQDAAGNVDGNTTSKLFKTGDDVTAPRFSGCSGATDPGATTALVSWNPATDDTSAADQIVYNVYAFTKDVDEDTAFGNAAGTFVGGEQGRVTGLLAGTQYSFVCRAQDISGNEDQNIAFRDLTTKDDGEPPDFDGIVGVEVDSTSATITWGEASDPDDQTPAEEIVYLIYQATDPTAVFGGQPVAISNPGATEFKVSGLKSNSQYYWGVRAQDNALNVDQNELQVGDVTLISFGLDVQPVFSRNCVKSLCHGSSNPPQGLNMDVGSSYFALVNITAIEAPTFKRILPNQPTQSYLVHKLRGTFNKPEIGGNGERMPRDADPLAEDDIKLIEDWVEQGARNN